jgi:hypothetical protein
VWGGRISRGDFAVEECGAALSPLFVCHPRLRLRMWPGRGADDLLELAWYSSVESEVCTPAGDALGGIRVQTSLSTEGGLGLGWRQRFGREIE